MTQTLSTITKSARSSIASVSPRGATVRIGKTETLVDWETLRRAAKQDDADLRGVYSDLLKSAEAMAIRTGPLAVSVGHPAGSTVGYRVYVRDLSGRDVLFLLPQRAAADGMTHHGGGIGNNGYTSAVAEAREIAGRLGNRATLSV